MFLTPCYNDFIYVYKYACLVKLKYLLEYQVNWTCTRPYFKSIPHAWPAVRISAVHECTRVPPVGEPRTSSTPTRDRAL